MKIYLTEIAKEEGKINVYAGCCVGSAHCVVPFKANPGSACSLDFELGLWRRGEGVSFAHLQTSMQIEQLQLQMQLCADMRIFVVKSLKQTSCKNKGKPDVV